MPNWVSYIVDQAILDDIVVWPTHGPRRIAHEPRSTSWGGILVCHWDVCKTLRWRQLHQRAAWLRRYELRRVQATGLVSEYTRQLVAARPAAESVVAHHPGDLVGIDTFYVGRLKGVGKIWQHTATDVASFYIFAGLSAGNNAGCAAHFADLLAAHYRDLSVPLRRALTDNPPE
jgi:hypothetical protein